MSAARRGLNRPLAFLAVVAAAVGPFLMSAPASAAPANDAGVDRFGSCMAASHSGQVLMLIDESRSLNETDPAAARVAAAKYLTEQLKSFAADTGSTIDIAVSGFSDTYQPRLGWTSIDDSSLDSVNSTLDGFADHTSGQDTDYWIALEGARTTLAEKVPSDPAARGCQMIAWFTDGELDYSTRPDASKPYAPGQSLDSDADRAEMVRLAQTSICRDGGLADQIRSSGIVTVAIGLAAGGTKPTDLDLLKGIATGQQTSAGECGAIRAPSPGDFYLAENIDDLLFAFDRLSTPGRPPLTNEAGACVVRVCDSAKHRFVLDSSVGSVNILAAADKTGLVPVLVAPDGNEIRIDPGQSGKTEVGGVAVDYKFPSDKAVSLRLTNSDAPLWTGAWALVFLAPDSATARTRSSIHITGDLQPRWTGADDVTLHAGDTAVEMKFAVVNSAGESIDAATLPGTATFDAELVTRNGKRIPIARGVSKAQVGTTRNVDLAGVSPGEATLRMTLSVTTASARDSDGTAVPGTVLAPARVDLPVTVAPPVGYPKVAPRADFGTVEGSGTGMSALAITGPGCVWLDQKPATFLASPDGAGDLRISSDATSQANCVKVDEGVTGELGLRLDVPEAVNGAANGVLTVMVAPADGSAPALAVDVPFAASLQKPLNTTNFVVALIVALILGPLIPLLLLYLVKWLTARIPGRGLRVEHIPVHCNGSTVLRNGKPFSVTDNDFVSLVPGLDGPTRRLDLGGLQLRTRIGRSPFGAGRVVATASGMAGAAGRSGETTGKTPDALLPLAVHNSWLTLHDPYGPETSATIVMLVGADADRTVIDRLAREVADNAPKVLAQLRSKALANLPAEQRPDAPAGPPNPFGSGGQGPAQPVGNPFAPSTGAPSVNPYPSGSPYPPATPTGAPGSNPFGPASSPPSAPPQRDPFRGPPGTPPPSGPPPGGHPPPRDGGNPFRR